MMKHMLVDPLLANGDNLTRDEFIEIWEKLPEVKFAELIGGIVYLSTPRCVARGAMNLDICGWLGYYNAYTPHCHGGANVTSFIGEDCPQPDDYLAIDEECGGRSFAREFLEGSPELIAEVAHTDAAIELHQKYDLYERAGIQEYIVALFESRELRWHRLADGKYRLMQPDADGVCRSRVFPGLWLDSEAFFANDMAKVLATLQEGIASDEHQKFVAELAKRKAAE